MSHNSNDILSEGVLDQSQWHMENRQKGKLMDASFTCSHAFFTHMSNDM